MLLLSLLRSRLLLLGLATLCLTSTVRAEVSRSAKKHSIMGGEWAYSPRKIPPGTKIAPPTNLRYAARDISGVWEFGLLFESTKIKLFPMRPGMYCFLLSANGCVGGWTAKRTATYKDGVLLLDRPVEQYASAPYSRLFTIRTSKGIRLISDRDLYFYLKEDSLLSPPRLAFENVENSQASPSSK